MAANAMFSLPLVEVASTARSSGALWWSEVVATFGLVLVIFALVRTGRSSAAPFAVGAYIGGAYFFTSSTSFANPAVTIARSLSDTFAGIAPRSVLPFVVAQLIGAGLAIAAIRVLYPIEPEAREDAGPQPGSVRPPAPDRFAELHDHERSGHGR